MVTLEQLYSTDKYQIAGYSSIFSLAYERSVYEGLKFNAVIFDLDGTLSDDRGRQHLIPKMEDIPVNWTEERQKAWDKYNSACINDPVNPSVLSALNYYLEQKDILVILLTGRKYSLNLANLTKQWLSADKNNIGFDALIMRAPNNTESNAAYKINWALSNYWVNVLKIYDDNPEVIEGFKKLGIDTVFIESGDISFE